MRLPEIAIQAGGVLWVLVAAGHTAFYRLFGWREEFERMRRLNRQVFYTIHVALYLSMLPAAFVSIVYPEQLARAEGIGGVLALSYALIWGWRLVWQLAYFGPITDKVSTGWRRFHYALVALFVVLTASYAGPVAAAWLSRV
jgi:hypothetical protein